ncbi:MAG: ABC transporter permease [Chloroflexi bacterium]|nr:ABC transporter permease [Chloroflexota bacterium]
MLRYIGHRVLSAIPTLMIIVILGFVVMELPPGDYATYHMMELLAQGNEGAREEAEALRIRYGMDRPAYERFFIWITHFVQGDFGDSFAYRKPVRELIGQNLLMTMVVSLLSLMIAWAIGVPIGIYSATHQYSLGDNFFTMVAFFGVGVPGFLLALVLLVVGTKWFGFVPAGLFSAEFENAPWSLAKFVDLLKHLWIPCLIVGVTQTAGLMRTMRGNLLDVLRMPYMQTARAKGLKETIVTWKYGVRNAIHPLIMSLGMSLPSLVSGATVTAIVLNLPVMGPIYLQAVRQQDIYLGGTMLILITVMLVIGNLLADLLLAVVDPRIRFE